MAKILIVAENPKLDTGQGRIGRTVAEALYNAGHGILYNAWCPSEINRDRKLPFNIVYAVDDYGNKKFNELIIQNRPDIVLTIGDIWNFNYINACNTRGLFKWVSYCAVDGLSVGGKIPNHHGDYLSGADYVIAYTDYGRRGIVLTMPYVENRIDKIYHGIDSKTFFPLSDEQRIEVKKKLNVDGKYMFLYSGRTHYRKNITSVLKAYKILLDSDKTKDYGLWINSNFNDPMGYRIDRFINELGLVDKVYTFTKFAYAQTPLDMISEKDYNLLFGMAGCLINVAAEGFGYNVAEAMFTKTPVITVDLAATGELGGNGRAWMVETGDYLTGLEMTEKPIINPAKLARIMRDCAHNDNTVMVEKAYKWAIENLEQKQINKQWARMLDKIEHPLKYDIILEAVA